MLTARIHPSSARFAMSRQDEIHHMPNGAKKETGCCWCSLPTSIALLQETRHYDCTKIHGYNVNNTRRFMSCSLSWHYKSSPLIGQLLRVATEAEYKLSKNNWFYSCLLLSPVVWAFLPLLPSLQCLCMQRGSCDKDWAQIIGYHNVKFEGVLSYECSTVNSNSHSFLSINSPPSPL